MNPRQRVVPLNTWALISNFKLAYNLRRRHDGGSFNREFSEIEREGSGEEIGGGEPQSQIRHNPSPSSRFPPPKRTIAPYQYSPSTKTQYPVDLGAATAVGELEKAQSIGAQFARFGAAAIYYFLTGDTGSSRSSFLFGNCSDDLGPRIFGLFCDTGMSGDGKHGFLPRRRWFLSKWRKDGELEFGRG
ncbi:unnamed protein product [Linum trigynum]|uniref:Uncharacterized protein n=1 Tax=Linum trigynum TaxID=586398 RepID=A0AAV2GI82_9ROSI